LSQKYLTSTIASVSGIYVSTARRIPSLVPVLTDLTTGSLTCVRYDRLGYHDGQKGCHFEYFASAQYRLREKSFLCLLFFSVVTTGALAAPSRQPALTKANVFADRLEDPAGRYSDFTRQIHGWKTHAIGCWKENILTNDRRDIPVPFTKNNFLNLFSL
jgi:hypothetical protein